MFGSANEGYYRELKTLEAQLEVIDTEMDISVELGTLALFKGLVGYQEPSTISLLEDKNLGVQPGGFDWNPFIQDLQDLRIALKNLTPDVNLPPDANLRPSHSKESSGEGDSVPSTLT